MIQTFFEFAHEGWLEQIVHVVAAFEKIEPLRIDGFDQAEFPCPQIALDRSKGQY